MADTLTTISIIFFIVAGVFAVLAVALWFLFKIPDVIGDLSGRTARKSIEQMRQNNAKTGNKSYKANEINLERSKLTSMKEGVRKKREPDNNETSLLNENRAQGLDSQETSLLTDNSTGAFNDSDETAALETAEEKMQRKASSVSIKLLDKVMYIHTEEVI